MESRRIIYYTVVGIITFATVIIACQGNKTKAVVIDPPASIAPMIRVTDDPESGGMPCVNPEQFQRFWNEYTETEEEVTDEQTASEEELEGVVLESETTEAVLQTESHLGVQQETEAEAQEESEVVETVVQGKEPDRGEVEGGTVCNETPIYLCHGQMLSKELQEYAYQTCEQFGIGWYFPHLICQMYQESGFRQSAVSPYGDYGLMQLKGIYHEYFKQLAGIPWADLINDPYANIYCGVALIAHYWNQCHDLNTTISAYNTGSVTTYNSAYVAQVRQHESALQQIR